jgi:hypothetical protein
LEAGAGRYKLKNEDIPNPSKRSDFHLTAELDLLEFVLIGAEFLAVCYVLSNYVGKMNAPVSSLDGRITMFIHRRCSF